MIQVFIAGHPRPGGSKTGIPIWRGKKGQPRIFTGHVAMIDSSGEKGKTWRQDIQHAIKQIYLGPVLDCPFVANFKFVFQRPKNHYRTGKNAGILKDDAPKCHTIKPDALKLARAVEDALTGIVWRDDSLVIDGRQTKEYGEKPGVHITIAKYPINNLQRSVFDEQKE